MKKSLFLLILTSLILLTGCGPKNEFTLKGKLNELSSDTLLVFYQHPSYQLDTIIAPKGSFTYQFTPDTLTVLNLILPGGKALPIYADKGEEATVSGTPDEWLVKGNNENTLLTQIRQRLAAWTHRQQSLTPSAKDSLMQAVDSCIQAHPYSFTSLYLIDQYYVQDTLPSTEHLKKLIQGLSGRLRDTYYISELIGQLDNWTAPHSPTRLTHISFKDKNGKFISLNALRDKYVLIDFWASWHPASLAEQDSLVAVQKALKKEKFLILSLSLDLDRQAWLQACGQRDTTQWRQVCDFRGWENALVKQQGIEELPANILVGPDKRILARNLHGKALIEKVKKHLQQDKEKEKAAEKAKRNAKR